MIDWILLLSLLSLTVSIVVGYRSLKLFSSKLAPSLCFSYAGFSVLVFLDIFKNFIVPAEKSLLLTDGMFILGVFSVYVSFAFFLFGYFIFRPKVVAPFSYESLDFNLNHSFHYFSLVGLLFVVLLVTFIPAGGFSFLFSGVLKGYFLILLCFALVKMRYIVVMFAALVLWFLTFGSDESSRRAFIALGSFFVIFLVLCVPSAKKYFSGKISIVFWTGAFFVFLNYLRANHNFGEDYVEGAAFANTLNYILSLRSIDTFANSALVVSWFGERYDFYFGSTYLAFFVSFIPREIWIDKPVGFAAPLALIYATGSQAFDLSTWQDLNYFSLSPGFVGEAYANFGWFGIVFLSFLLGFYVQFVDKRIRKIGYSIDNVAWFAFLPFFFLVMRGDFYSAINFPITLFFGVKIFFLVNKIKFSF